MSKKLLCTKCEKPADVLSMYVVNGRELYLCGECTRIGDGGSIKLLLDSLCASGKSRRECVKSARNTQQ